MSTAPAKPQRRQPSLWRRPLLVGACFGLGYGLTQRLLDLRLPALVTWGHAFDVREVPGTSLESLRQRYGREAHDLRGSDEPSEPKAEASSEAATDMADSAKLDEGSEPTGGKPLPDAGAAEPAIPSAPQLPAPEPSQP